MRRKLSIIGLLLLALCVSGWSSVLAAAFNCRHAKGVESRATTAHDNRSLQDHSCCPAKAKHAQSPHCSAPQQHKAMGGIRVIPVASAHEVAVGQPEETCTHCIDRPDLPATPTIGQTNQVKPNIDAAMLRESARLSTLVAPFAPPVQSRQGAPPFAANRKHLLFSVFLI
jgi:hypothetical protein